MAGGDFVEIPLRGRCQAGLAATADNGAHRGVGNRLHRVMDVVFHDDLMHLRTNQGPARMDLIRHAALNIFKKTKGKLGLENRKNRPLGMIPICSQPSPATHDPFRRFPWDG
ncbi:MAG: hypothetical protein U5K36_03630 [Roseovarius sp.]|nr:hypothetical protein [Roseovarius sp.]